jgi:hypothetical protein
MAGTLSVLLLFTGVHSILSRSHVDGTVPATAPSDPPIPEGPRSTAPAAKAPSAAPIRVDAAGSSAPSDARIPEGPGSTAPATKAPSAAPIRVDSAVEQANLTKQSRSADAPVYRRGAVPAALEQDYLRKGFLLDAQSGNYLGPKTYNRTLHEPLVPVPIDGKYAKDLRGHTVFLRQTIRDKLLTADAAMFKNKGQHLKINYGFRSNELQYELYQEINGHGKVAQPGMSFHETGMAIDLSNWRDAQGFMIDAGFVGGCYGIEEDLVHYSINEITKASNFEEFKRCTLKEIPKDILKGVEKVGGVITGGHFPGSKKKPQ